MAERSTNSRTRRRETASLLLQSLVRRVVDSAGHVPPRLQPTIFLPLRRGEDPSWKDVVARNV
jgi:hypothetical protein